jgi:serine/threonine-protein kinase
MDGVEIWPEDFFEAVVWNLVVLFLAVCVAAVASRINFGLRHQVREAQRLGQYRLEERIGEGAMGEVYRGKHAMLRRPTAIKLIHPDATDPDMLQRFEREVRETSRLSHPNTIRVFDYGRTPEGVFYYAMEYLDGANLREIVERSGPMPPARVIHALTQVCGALQEAHDTGLVHRDIKPGNIILCQRGGVYDVIKVVDFGLVKDLGAASPALTQVGQICGTPETMAPEVLGGAEATPASDLYAVGVVAYYLLTGTPVFDASSATEFIGHHLHTPPLPLHERIPSVPPDLAAAVHRCLAKDPADRFASARQLKVALERCTDADGWTENRDGGPAVEAAGKAGRRGALAAGTLRRRTADLPVEHAVALVELDDAAAELLVRHPQPVAQQAPQGLQRQERALEAELQGVRLRAGPVGRRAAAAVGGGSVAPETGHEGQGGHDDSSVS